MCPENLGNGFVRINKGETVSGIAPGTKGEVVEAQLNGPLLVQVAEEGDELVILKTPLSTGFSSVRVSREAYDSWDTITPERLPGAVEKYDGFITVRLSPRSREVEDSLRDCVKRRFARTRTESLREVWLWMKNNPVEFSIRLLEFQNTIDLMKGLLGEDADSNVYANRRRLRELKTRLGEDNLFSLEELMERHQMGSDRGDPIPKLINAAFTRIVQNIKTGKWQLPVEVSSYPEKLSSSLLIEGYGFILESYYDIADLGRTFAFAFEETLGRQRLPSEVWRDLTR